MYIPDFFDSCLTVCFDKGVGCYAMSQAMKNIKLLDCVIEHGFIGLSKERPYLVLALNLIWKVACNLL